jgi:hypothetical protein
MHPNRYSNDELIRDEISKNCRKDQHEEESQVRLRAVVEVTVGRSCSCVLFECPSCPGRAKSPVVRKCYVFERFEVAGRRVFGFSSTSWQEFFRVCVGNGFVRVRRRVGQ